MEKYKIGIIGTGMVGGALQSYFEKKENYELFLFDKNKKIGSMEEVNKADFIYICVPTPTLDNGTFDLSIVEDVMGKIEAGKVVILKSTILPGTTSKLQLSFPDLKILFNPEFLTEVTADQDMEFPDRQILGYTKESYNVSKDVMLQLPLATFEKIVPAYVAEFCKYAANTWFSAKVAKNNEMYDLFMKFNQSEEDYKDMISCISGDRRIGRTHLKVWHKGYRGYGGKCLIAGTKLRNDGDEFINIEDVEKGDYIYNGSKMDIVTGKEEREVDGVIKITARGRSIAGSKDHIHFVVENNKLIEKKFEDVKVGDYLYVPFQKDQNNDKIYLGEKPNNHIQFWKKEVIINDNLARLLGLYVAEGCMNKYKSSVIWSFGEREGEFADEVITRLDMIGLHGSKKLQVSDGTFGISRCWIVRCRYKWLYELLDKIGVGHGAHEKNIPLLSDELAKSFIGGWLDGDGSYYDGTIAGHSESKELIRKIDTMLLSLEINAQISKDGKKIKISKRDDVERVCGWTKRLRFDKNRYKTIIVYASPTVKKMKTGWAVRITKIEELPKQKVYAIEMRYKIYVANNILTHNCLPKDTKALLSFAKELGVEMPITEAIDKFNDVLVKEQGLKPLHIDGRLENLTDEDKRFSTGK